MIKIYNIGVDKFNSYLILAEKNVIIDTVPSEHFKTFKENIRKYIDLSELDCLVFTRTTPDASGCAESLILENKNIEVFASVAGLKNLKEITNLSFNENVIKNEDTLDLGSDVLKFLITPNLSWPDTSVCYLENRKTLFSGNLFCESPEFEYFQKVFFENAVNKINNLGIIEFLPAYGEYPNGLTAVFFPEPNPEKIAVIYASFSGQTKKMAEAVASEIKDFGKQAILLDAENVSTEEIVNISEKCVAFAFGTPTVNHTAAKSVLDVICSLNVLKNAEKRAFIFGSYGWSGEGTNIVSSLLSNLKVRPFKKPFRTIFNPSVENISDLKSEVRSFLKEIENA